MKKHLMWCGSITFMMLAGCAGPNSTARNVETAASINSLAGVPGAGWVGLAASAADIFSKVGKPTTGKPSEGILKHMRQSPQLLKLPNKEGKITTRWVTRKDKDGRVISVENSPKESMAYTEAYIDATSRFLGGDFGDGGEAKVRANLEAWEKGGLVVAEYNDPNGTKVIIVSNHNDPGEAMLPTEWAEKAKSQK